MAVVFAASLCARVAFASPAPFRWLVPAPAPAAWHHGRLPAYGGILSYPPSLAPISSGRDTSSVSVAEKDRSGRILVYLNATPREGTETLRNWPDFRIAHNRGESKAVHEEGRAFGLSFLGGKGSCVMDRYTTRFKDNHYREIACLVQGRARASVVVAAALESRWAGVAKLLERAVSAYRA